MHQQCSYSKFCKMIVLQNVHNNNNCTAIAKLPFSRATKTFDLNKNNNYKYVLISVSQPVFRETLRFLEYRVYSSISRGFQEQFLMNSWLICESHFIANCESHQISKLAQCYARVDLYADQPKQMIFLFNSWGKGAGEGSRLIREYLRYLRDKS